MAFNFQDQQVWVTGAGQGIGRCIAESFKRQGARVLGIDRQFPATDYSFETGLLDIADAPQVDAFCSEMLSAGRGPQVLVNAAAVLRLGALDELSLADWQACLDVNLTGSFLLLRRLIPHFKAQASGAVVTLASNAAHVPRLKMAAYCVSKAALVSLSHCAALELAPYGVRCNLVSPGSTDTPMFRQLLGDPAGSSAAIKRTIAGLPEQFKLGIPLQKIAQPQEIANAVLFLASDLASHITLQDLVVDGGATLCA